MLGHDYARLEPERQTLAHQCEMFGEDILDGVIAEKWKTLIARERQKPGLLRLVVVADGFARSYSHHPGL